MKKLAILIALLLGGLFLAFVGPYVTWMVQLDSSTERLIVRFFSWMLSIIGFVMFCGGVFIALLLYFKHYSRTRGVYYVPTKPNGVTLMYASLTIYCLSAVCGMIDVGWGSSPVSVILLVALATIAGIIGFKRFRNSSKFA